MSDNPITKGSFIKYTDSQKLSVTLNINKVFYTQDYKLVFFDDDSYSSCKANSDKTRNATADTTLGYIMGFRTYTEYDFTEEFEGIYDAGIDPNNPRMTISSNRVSITSDSVAQVSLYNTLYIILEDYNQSHMNDGLVTITRRDTQIRLPTRTQYRCNPYTSIYEGIAKTNNQIIAQSEQNQINETSVQSKLLASSTSLKDVFAIVPVKFGLAAGSTYVEFGGTLQAQERTYFGPVNLNRFRVKLMTDKGNTINLNGADWQFQIIVEQLYKTPE